MRNSVSASRLLFPLTIHLFRHTLGHTHCRHPPRLSAGNELWCSDAIGALFLSKMGQIGIGNKLWNPDEKERECTVSPESPVSLPVYAALTVSSFHFPFLQS